MGGEGLASATRFLVFALSVFYLLGAASMPAGELGLPRRGRSALRVSPGAALRGLALFWTLLVALAVATVSACNVALARRSAPA